MKEPNNLRKKRRKAPKQYLKQNVGDLIEHYFVPFEGNVYCLVDNKYNSKATKDELELIENISKGKWTLVGNAKDKEHAENMMLTYSYHLNLNEYDFGYHISGIYTLVLYKGVITEAEHYSLEGKPMYKRTTYTAKEFFEKYPTEEALKKRFNLK